MRKIPEQSAKFHPAEIKIRVFSGVLGKFQLGTEIATITADDLVVSALNKKLFRDLLHLRGQLFAIGLVVACGVASFVAMRSTYDSLLASQDEYYLSYRFADIFTGLKRAPPPV